MKVCAGSLMGAQPGVSRSPAVGCHPLNGQIRRPVKMERRAGTVAMASG